MASPYIYTFTNGSVKQYLFIGYYVACILILLGGVRWVVGRAKAQQAKAREALKQAEETGGEVSEGDKRRAGFSRLMFVWIVISIAAGVVSNLVLSNSSARKLTVPQSDAIADSNNFLSPFGDVFQFFEDGMTVRIGQAVGAGNFGEVGLLMKWAAVGGFACGAAGATLSTVVTYIYPIFNFFVPLRQGVSLPTDCPLIPAQPAELQAIARPYWILSAWAWPATFITRGIIGVYVGSGETQNWAIASVLQYASVLGVYFLLIDSISHTTAMGLVSLFPPFVFLAASAAVFLQKKYRKMFQLNRSILTPKARRIGLRAARDGISLMTKDLVLTVESSMTNMLAANLGLGPQYQLSIFGTIDGTFGSGAIFPTILGYTVRLVGSRVLGEGKRIAFRNFTKGMLLGACMFGAVGTISIFLVRNSAPYSFASDQVCEYQEEACSMVVYNAIFGDIHPGYILNAIMQFVGAVVAVETAILYATLDFAFIRNTTVVIFFVAYMPVSFVGYFLSKSIFVVQLAGSLPTILTCLVYTWKILYKVYPEMSKGDVAPNDNGSSRNLNRPISGEHSMVRLSRDGDDDGAAAAAVAVGDDDGDDNGGNSLGASLLHGGDRS